MGSPNVSSPVLWKFVEEGHRQWVWHRLNDHFGEPIEISVSFPDYGAAVWDAIRRGFSPKRQSWVVTSRGGGTTVFEATAPVGDIWSPRHWRGHSPSSDK